MGTDVHGAQNLVLCPLCVMKLRKKIRSSYEPSEHQTHRLNMCDFLMFCQEVNFNLYFFFFFSSSSTVLLQFLSPQCHGTCKTFSNLDVSFMVFLLN